MCARQAEQQAIYILFRTQNVQYPDTWENVQSQTANLQLYNVDPASPEVAAVVQEVESSGKRLLKVSAGSHMPLNFCCLFLDPPICNKTHILLWAQIQNW